MGRLRIVRFSLLSVALALAGCGLQSSPAGLGTDLTQVDRIRNDADLSPQQRRDALAALGIDPVTINGLLGAERLANQFGGDVESAFRKISGGSLNTLTPDEVQAYGDATNLTTYADAEAQLIATLFAERGIRSADELMNLLDDPAGALPTGIDEQNLRDVFVDFNPEDVLDNI